jgi:hypothetical protein
VNFSALRQFGHSWDATKAENQRFDRSGGRTVSLAPVRASDWDAADRQSMSRR